MILDRPAIELTDLLGPIQGVGQAIRIGHQTRHLKGYLASQSLCTIV
jgi:hypothetical protein